MASAAREEGEGKGALCAEPAFADLSLDVSNESSTRLTTVAAARALFPPFSALPASASFTVSVVSGGITNQLYRVEGPGGESCLVRRFGDRTDLVINRSQENAVVATLTELSFGPKAYGCVRNGRVEEFLKGRNMRAEDMVDPTLMPLVGARLAELHALELPGLERQPQTWATLDGWMRTAMACDFSDSPERQRAFDALGLDRLRRSVLEYRELLAASGAADDERHACFAHNDLLSGNVMLDREPGGDEPPTVTFIDYEYGAYGYRGFDVANHFLECCGFECEWDRFPDERLRRAFFGGYARQAGGDGCPPTDELLREAEAWLPMPHAWWAFWAVVQARHSPIDFDFLAYAGQRAAGYWLHRERGERACRAGSPPQQ